MPVRLDRQLQPFILRKPQMPDYCPSAFMHFGVREIAAAISAAALIFCCSCEKHPLGQDPEVQKERVDEAKGGAQNAAEPSKEGTNESATQKPTPAEFFPKSTPSP
jgi:hypothetical protein